MEKSEAKPEMSVSQKTFKSMKVVEQTIRNKSVFVSLILISAVLLVVMLVFSALAVNPKLKGPFHHSIGNVSAMFPLHITPAGSAFSIWGVIYLIQVGSTLYSLSLLCRKTEDGQPAYTRPVILSPMYFVLLSLNSILTIGWLFEWDRLMFSASLVFLATTAVALFSCLTIVMTRLSFYKADLIENGRKFDIFAIRVLVLNGLGMYATWSTIATLLNFGVALTYKWHLDVSVEKASVICLGILFALVVIYSVLDLTVSDRFTRFTFTPYATVIWALSAIIAKNWNVSNWSSIICAILLSAVSVLFIVKVALFIYREQKISNPYRRLNVGGAFKLQKK